MPPVTIAVVGAGIAGLASAYRLRRELGAGAEIILVEATRSLGGKLRTIELAGTAVDVGAEAFVVRNPAAVALIDELGLSNRLVHPVRSNATVHVAGRTVDLPARTMLGLPADPTQLRSVLSPAAAAMVAAESALPPLVLSADPDQPDVSVGEIVAARFGRELVDRLVEPLLGGVYAGRADLLGLRATMPGVVAAIEAGARSLTAAAARVLGSAPQDGRPRPSVFGAVRGGMGVLVDKLVKRAKPVVRLGVPVSGLRRDSGGWRLSLGAENGQHELLADAVVLAVPAPAARRLLTAVVPAAADGYAAIDVASMAVVSLALPADAALPASTGVLLAAGERHGGATGLSGELFTAKAFTFTSTKWGRQAGDPVVLRASVGRFGEAGILRRDDAELVDAVRADLAELTGITATPIDHAITRWGGGLPQYGIRHTAAVARIERSVAALPGLAVAGAALHGVGIPACIDTGYAAAERVLRHVRSLARH